MSRLFVNPDRFKTKPAVQIVAGKGGIMINTGGGPANSNFTMQTCRSVSRTGASGVRNLRLAYTNGTTNSAGEVVIANAITVRAALEILRDDGSTRLTMPLAFNGALTATIDGAAGVVFTDPIGAVIPANTIFAIRSEVTVPAGGVFPTGWINQDIKTHIGGPNWAGSGENYVRSDGSVSQVYGTGFFSGSPSEGYGPLAVIGEPIEKTPAVAIIGDSIARGSGDGTTTEMMVGMTTGFIGRAMATNLAAPGASLPYVRLARDGASVSFFQSTASGFDKARLWLPLKWCSHVICNLGNNDIAGGSTAAQIQNNLIALWASLKSQGLKVYQCTLFPRVTGTYTTPEGQTIVNNYQPGGKRDQVNAWIIANGPQYIDGVIDINPAVEDPNNPGKWRTDGGVAYVHDGVHPSAVGHIAAATVVRGVTATFSV